MWERREREIERTEIRKNKKKQHWVRVRSYPGEYVRTYVCVCACACASASASASVCACACACACACTSLSHMSLLNLSSLLSGNSTIIFLSLSLSLNFFALAKIWYEWIKNRKQIVAANVQKKKGKNFRQARVSLIKVEWTYFYWTQTEPGSIICSELSCS